MAARALVVMGVSASADVAVAVAAAEAMQVTATVTAIVSTVAAAVAAVPLRQPAVGGVGMSGSLSGSPRDVGAQVEATAKAICAKCKTFAICCGAPIAENSGRLV